MRTRPSVGSLALHAGSSSTAYRLSSPRVTVRPCRQRPPFSSTPYWRSHGPPPHSGKCLPVMGSRPVVVLVRSCHRVCRPAVRAPPATPDSFAAWRDEEPRGVVPPSRSPRLHSSAGPAIGRPVATTPRYRRCSRRYESSHSASDERRWAAAASSVGAAPSGGSFSAADALTSPRSVRRTAR